MQLLYKQEIISFADGQFIIKPFMLIVFRFVNYHFELSIMVYVGSAVLECISYRA